MALSRLQVFLTWGLVYCLIVSTVNTERRFLLFICLYMLWNLKMSQHGARTWAERGFGFAGWGASGSPGWWQNSGEFGAQMAIFFPLALYVLISVRQRLGKAKLLVLSLLPFTAAASIIASNSRGAILACAATLVAVFLFSRGSLRMLLLVVAIGYGAYSVIPPESLERFQTAGDDETSVNRLVRWEAGYEIYKEHPFVGIGPNNFWYYYVSNFPREEGSEGWGLSHNTFVDVLAEHGTVGALLYLCLIAANFLLNRQTRAVAAQTGRTFSRDVAYGLDCAMIACVVSSFFMSVLHYPTFWMHLAMTVSLNNVIRRGAGQVA